MERLKEVEVSQEDPDELWVCQLDGDASEDRQREQRHPPTLWSEVLAEEIEIGTYGNHEGPFGSGETGTGADLEAIGRDE